MESLKGGGIWEKQNSSNFIVSCQNVRVLWQLLSIMYIDSYVVYRRLTYLC